ncbi:MAG: TetR/AcrR family transcriptional regulator [Desulfobacteraceae bacterium]|nr:TetR/AcrR family transcriptional regulator [Desulfobacteraceae bacterium]
MGVQERRLREKQERRRQILDASRQLLITLGLDAISINLIAKEAEIGVGTIYFHFKNKDEILAAIQAEGLSILHKDVEKIANSSQKIDEKLRDIGFAYLTFSEKQKFYFDIINYFLSAPEVIFTPELKERIDLAGFKIISLITSVIEEGLGQKRFPDDVQPDKIAIAFWGAVHGWILLKKMKHTILQGQSHREFFAFAVDYFIQTMDKK